MYRCRASSIAMRSATRQNWTPRAMWWRASSTAQDTVPDYMIKNRSDLPHNLRQPGQPAPGGEYGDRAIAQRLDYDEFGNVTLDTNPGFQPFGYAGGLYDRDTGLVRSGARDYDPFTGRWTTKDPMSFGGGDANLYAYVNNNPLNEIDPTGQGFWRNVRIIIETIVRINNVSPTNTFSKPPPSDTRPQDNQAGRVRVTGLPSPGS